MSTKTRETTESVTHTHTHTHTVESRNSLGLVGIHRIITKKEKYKS